MILPDGAGGYVVSVIRAAPNCNTVVILMPPYRGRRTGPARLYVELARDLGALGIASVCTDNPVNASPRSLGNFFQYLRTLEGSLSTKQFEKYIWIGFSLTAIPVLKYASRREHNAILISPNHEGHVNETLADEINYLCILGEKDPIATTGIPYWKNIGAKGKGSIDLQIIDDADHLFSSWETKQKVIRTIREWLTRVVRQE